jgi:transposase
MENRANVITELRKKWEQMSPFLDERSRRIWTGVESRQIGLGGKTILHEATGMSRRAIAKGEQEMASRATVDKRIRRAGGGRKRKTEKIPNLVERLEDLVEPYTKGDPVRPLRWTSKSTHKLSAELKSEGISVSHKTVGRILENLNYSLQLNRKEKEGGEHTDRDAQFEFINNKVEQFISGGKAAVSVDTKKKENIGNYKNGGREYHKSGEAPKVKVYDFIDKELGKVAPYGVYDMGLNKGWVNVGISSDTAAFAVNSIRSWYCQMGQAQYAKTDSLLITADCGGSNSHRGRLWKVELQKLADEIHKTIHVCHFPPGTSKWNKIEHKMFCFITMNWRGKPLISQQTVVQLISNTTTKSGLTIKAALDENTYQKGITVSDEELAKVNLVEEKFHGEWNYKIEPNII